MPNNPPRAPNAAAVTTGPGGCRAEPLSVAEYKALTAPKQAGKGKTPAALRSANVEAKERAARAAVVGVGRLAWENPVFGLPAYYRKFRLLEEEQAKELDQAFYRIVGITPENK